MNRRNNNNNDMGGASAPPYERATNDLLFKSAIATLRGSSEWQTQVWVSWGVSFLLALYGFSTIESKTDNEKTMMYAFVVLACYSAMNLSSIVRDRAEAALIRLHGRGSNLYSEVAIAALEGSHAKYLVTWAVFLGTLGTLTYMFMWTTVEPLKRYFIAASVVGLVSQTFNVSKNVRDRHDAEKLASQYDYANIAQTSADL